MVLKADQMRVKALLTETITLLCKNGLNYQSEFAIEALIGITLDQDDVFLVSIKETIRTDLGLDKDLDSPDDHREFRIEATRTSAHQDIKDGLDSAPDLSIMVQLDKSEDDGQLVTTPNGSSAPVPRKLFRSMHGDSGSVGDMGDTQTSYSSDSAPSSMTFAMRDFDTGSSTTGGGDTLHRERSIDSSDHIRQPPLKKSRSVDESGDRSVKEESESDDDVVVIKEEAGLDALSCQMDSYNRTGMMDTSGTLTSVGAATVTQDTISSIVSSAANLLPHSLTLSTSAPVFPGCSTWDQLPSISAHSLPQTTASPSASMSGTPSQQSQHMSQVRLFHIVDYVKGHLWLDIYPVFGQTFCIKSKNQERLLLSNFERENCCFFTPDTLGEMVLKKIPKLQFINCMFTTNKGNFCNNFLCLNDLFMDRTCQYHVIICIMII